MTGVDRRKHHLLFFKETGVPEYEDRYESPVDEIFQVIRAAVEVQSSVPYNLDYPVFQVLAPATPHLRRYFIEHPVDKKVEYSITMTKRAESKAFLDPAVVSLYGPHSYKSPITGRIIRHPRLHEEWYASDLSKEDRKLFIM